MAEPTGPNAARDADPDAHLARVRGLDYALVAHAARARRRRRLGAVLGALALGAGAALAALGAAAVIASPLSWIAAGASALTGLGALTAARAAARREAAATRAHKRLRLGHGGRALAIDPLIARLDALRDATASDYARYEARALAALDPRQQAERSALLQRLRARQLDHVRRLDLARERALALRSRLAAAALAPAPRDRDDALSAERLAYEDRLARTIFDRAEIGDELSRLDAETDALEALEAEYRG